MSLADNIKDVAFSSTTPTDNVIGVYEGSITIPVRTATMNTNTITTGLTVNPFFVGIFQVDGNDEYYDVGSQHFFDDGAGAPTGYGVSAYAQNGNIYVTTTTNDTSSHSCTYKIAAVAQPQQGIVDVPEDDRPTVLKYIASEYTYRKMQQDTVQAHTITSAATSSVSIAHSLGYTPSVMAFIEVDGKMYDATSRPTIFTGSSYTSCRPEIRVSTTHVTYFFHNSTGSSKAATLYLRVYYDEN